MGYIKHCMLVLAVCLIFGLGLAHGVRADDAASHGDWAANRSKMIEQLKTLPPDERREKMKELRQQMQVKRAEALQERQQKFDDRWSKATPEQKAKFCEKARQHCTEKPNAPACQMVQKACAGL